MSEPAGLDQFLNSQPAPSAAPPPANGEPPGIDNFLNSGSDEEKYGGVGSQIEAGLEGVARGATLGASDVALTKSGLVTPEHLKGVAETNPWTAGLGTLGGGAGLIALTGGLAAPAEAALGTGALATGAALTGEGALFGAGSAASDYAMGDPNLNAQKIATHVGLGALLGLAAGGAGYGIKSILGKFGGIDGSVAEAIDSSAGSTPPPPPPVSDAASQPVVDLPAETPTPKSLSDIEKLVAQAKAEGQTTELPQKQIALDAESRLSDLKYPLHNLQIDSLDSQDARDLYKIAMEMPTEQGRAAQDYETIQKNERLGALDDSIQNLSPGTENTSNLVDGGQRAIDTFTGNYEAQQEALKPALTAIRQYETQDPFNHIPGVIQTFTDKIPGIARMFDTTGDELKINPYSTAWDFKKPTYEAVKQVVTDLQDPAFIKELMGIRNGMSNHVNIMDGSGASGEIAKLKSGFLDYIQNEIEKVDPVVAASPDKDAAHIRGVLKDWAINEGQREVIEKTFGASVGSPEWSQLSKVKNENILGKIFSNTATVKAAKSFMKPEQFNEMLSNYLAAAREASSTEGVFSSKKFGTFLTKNRYVLEEALRDNPGIGQRMQDLTTTMRMFPDSGTINPPRTAKTLMGILKPNEVGEINPGTILGGAKSYFGEMIEGRQLAKKVNEALANKAVQQQKFSGVKKISDAVDSKISDGIDSILGAKK